MNSLGTDASVGTLHSTTVETTSVEGKTISLTNSAGLITTYLSGTSLNLIKFLLDIADMLYPIIKEKYPKLDFTEYEKLNK